MQDNDWKSNLINIICPDVDEGEPVLFMNSGLGSAPMQGASEDMLHHYYRGIPFVWKPVFHPILTNE